MARRDEDRAGENNSSESDDEFDALGAARELEESLAEAEPAGASGDAGVYVEMLEGEIAALGQELEVARADLRKAEARADRVASEAERAKERLARESDKDRTREHGRVLSRFLEVLDDLDRAIAAARKLDHNPEVLNGVALVRKRFLAAMGEFGVRHVPALGERFDPQWHDAVSAVPVSDPSEDGVVVGVVAEGYALGDEALRPARVAVGKAP